MEPASIVGIDVGTTKICTLIAQVNELEEIRIVGAGIVPAKGIRKGVVVSVNEATNAIAESLRLAEQSSGYQIASAYIGLAGAHINALNSRGTIAVNNGRKSIKPDDINRVLEAARAVSLPDNREILHIIARNFIVDGDDGVKDPVGMYAQKLEVEAHIVIGATSSVNNLLQCVQNNHVEVDALVLEPLASGEAVLSDIEREMGVVLADIGGGTTDIAIFIEGSIWHTVVLPTGGQQITNDIVVGLRAPFETAESLKIRFGRANPAKIAEDETLEFVSFGEGARQKVSRRFLAEIIQARVEEIFELIQQEIKRSGYDGLLPAGVVLCGGSANLPGIKTLGQEIFDLPVRVGAPRNLRGLIDNLDEPAFATSVGLLEWGKHHQPKSSLKQKQSGRLKAPAWLKAFLPG